MNKRIDFTKKIKIKDSPDSIQDFLENSEHKEKDLNNLKQSKTFYKREEFKLPIDLSEKLRSLSFQMKTTKTEIVLLALKDFFKKNL